MDYRTLVLIMMILAGVLMAGCISQNNTMQGENKTTESGIASEPITSIKTPHQEDGGKPASEAGVNETYANNLTDAQSGSQEIMPLNDTVNIYLKENPTTGFQWNATVTSGLTIENDTYIADPAAAGVTGSGGMHYWLVRSIGKGNQHFDAIYKRSWEPVTGNETSYTLDIQVV